MKIPTKRPMLIFVFMGFASGLLFGFLLDISTSPIVHAAYSILNQQDALHNHTKVHRFADVHSGHHEGETMAADGLAKATPIYAFILTDLGASNDQINQIKTTWAGRFKKYIFISNEEDPTLPSISSPLTKVNNKNWNKVRFAIKNAYQHELNHFDYFMKVNDENYVIVENLLLLLSKMNRTEAVLIGRQITQKRNGRHSMYISGAAGYVMSRAALRLIAKAMLANTTDCQENNTTEDVNLGRCATSVGVRLVAALDGYGHQLFHNENPFTVVTNAGYLAKNSKLSPAEVGKNPKFGSDHSISFGHVSNGDASELEYFVYHLYPYGITRDLRLYEEAAAATQPRKAPKQSV